MARVRPAAMRDGTRDVWARQRRVEEPQDCQLFNASAFVNRARTFQVCLSDEFDVWHRDSFVDWRPRLSDASSCDVRRRRPPRALLVNCGLRMLLRQCSRTEKCFCYLRATMRVNSPNEKRTDSMPRVGLRRVATTAGPRPRRSTAPRIRSPGSGTERRDQTCRSDCSHIASLRSERRNAGEGWLLSPDDWSRAQVGGEIFGLSEPINALHRPATVITRVIGAPQRH